MVDSDSGLHTPFFTRVVFVVFYTRRFCKVPRFVLRDLLKTFHIEEPFIHFAGFVPVSATSLF